jgi:hypothetical protein
LKTALNPADILARHPVVSALIERLSEEDKTAVQLLAPEELSYYRKLRRFGWTHSDAMYRLRLIEQVGRSLP